MWENAILLKRMSRGKIKLKGVFMLAALLIGAGVFLFGASALAQIPSGGIIPKCDWAAGETYGLGAFTQLALNVLKLIWGILGSLALVMFVWGGFLWLTARGEENQIKQGWDTLVNAVIGLLIVLGSWLIINTIILSLTDPGNWTHVAVVFEKNWTELVREDVCVNIAAHVKGAAIAKGILGVGGGGCCYKGSATGMFKSGGLDTCKELARAGTEEVVHCPGGVDGGACGDIESGSDGRPHWKNVSCEGAQALVFVDKDQRCGDFPSTIRMCADAMICEKKFGNDANDYCIDEKAESGLCFLMYEGTNASDLDDKKTIVRKFPLNREECKAQAPEGAAITEGGKTYNATYKEKKFCSGARPLTEDTRFFLNIWRVAGWLNSIIFPEDEPKCVKIE